MKSIPILINQLSKTNIGHDMFRSYSGTDWREFIRYRYDSNLCNPVLLWKNNKMELVALGWREKQELRMFCNYQVIYSRLLEGSLDSTLILPDKNKISKRISSGCYIYSPPFSVWEVVANQPSSSLHLLCNFDVN